MTKIFLLIICLSVSLQKYMKHGLTHQMKHKHKHRKYSIRNHLKHKHRQPQRIVKRSAEYMYNQNLDNQAAEQIYSMNPQGRSESSDELISSGQIMLRVKHKTLDDDGEGLQSLHYKLNKHSLYFLEEDTLRGVLNGVQLADIVGRSDKMEQYQCCSRISDVKNVMIETYSFQGFCFKIEMPTLQYLICDDRKQKIEQFQQQLIQAIFDDYFSRMHPGESAPRLVQQQSKCDSFSWGYEQYKWQCGCNSQGNQSPIRIHEYQAEPVYSELLSFSFSYVQSVQYSIQGNEPEFTGDFGSFKHITPNDNYSYRANKIIFKVKGSEHKLDLDNIVGELLIYGSNQYMQQAVLSILIQINGVQNQCIKDMQLDRLSFEGNQSKCLGSSFNLLDFIKSGVELSEDRSFYYYDGSYTKPPCQSNVRHFVMKYPASINSQQYNQLQNNILMKAQISPNNIRQEQPLNGRKVYYYQQKCFKPRPKPLVDDNREYKYIKASQTMTHYAAVADQMGKEVVDKVFRQHGNKKGELEIGRNLRIQRMDQNLRDMVGFDPRSFMSRNIQVIRKRKRRR